MTSQDFLNPKSMITPGVAGGIVMMITNTLYFQFGLPARWTGLVLSFLVALVVLGAVAIPLWQRLVYYSLNALIIFAVATGSNSAGAALSTRPADAEEPAAETPPEPQPPAPPASPKIRGLIDLEDRARNENDPAARAELHKHLEALSPAELEQYLRESEKRQPVLLAAPSSDQAFFRTWF